MDMGVISNVIIPFSIHDIFPRILCTTVEPIPKQILGIYISRSGNTFTIHAQDSGLGNPLHIYKMVKNQASFITRVNLHLELKNER